MSDNISLKNKRDQFVGKDGKVSKSKYLVVGTAVIILLAVAALVFWPGGSATSVQPSPEEAKYIGLYLPEGYKAAKLTEPITYSKRIDMTDIAPVLKDGAIRIAAGDVIKNRIVYFEYTRPADKRVITMMAYIKPSGKLFTGVSFCPPCRAKRQSFDTDGLLTCGACSTKRDPETQAGISGACKLYPFDEMPHKLVGDKILIAESDLAGWKDQPIDRPVGGE